MKRVLALSFLALVLLASPAALARPQSEIDILYLFASTLQFSATDSETLTQIITYDEDSDLFLFNTRMNQLDSATAKLVCTSGTEYYASLLDICKSLYDTFEKNLEDLGYSVDIAVTCTTSDGVIIMAYMNGIDCTSLLTQ